MVTIKNSYALLGLGLLLAGILLAGLANFILVSVPLTALGISTLIIGGVSLALARGQPKIPAEVSAIFLNSGVENTAAIVEELGLKSKAIYLPSSKTSGNPQALIALFSNPHLPKIEKALPRRLIVKLGDGNENMGLLLSTPGSGITGSITSKLDATSGDLEAALSSVLVGTLELVDAVRVTTDTERVVVEVSNPRLDQENMQVYEWLGSPLASMVASIVVEVLDKSVSITKEKYSKSKQVIELKLVG